MRIASLAGILSLTAACTFSPSVSPDEAAVLRTAAQPLLAVQFDHNYEVPESEWPASIQEILDPVSIWQKHDGVYVTTSDVFVESRGLFFPRDPTFVPIQGTDPSLAEVIPGVYQFHIKG